MTWFYESRARQVNCSERQNIAELFGRSIAHDFSADGHCIIELELEPNIRPRMSTARTIQLQVQNGAAEIINNCVD